MHFVSIPYCPSSGHHCTESGSDLSAASFQVFMDNDEIPQASSCPGWTVLNSLMGEVLQARHHLSGCLLKYHRYVQVFLLLGSPGLDTGHGLRKCPAEGKDHLPWPTVNRLLTQLRILFIFSVARAHFWLMFSLLSTRSPGLFPHLTHSHKSCLILNTSFFLHFFLSHLFSVLLLLLLKLWFPGMPVWKYV